MATKIATGLRITTIRNQANGAKDANDEWIRIVNEGTQRWKLVDCEITDETRTQTRPHIYTLPAQLHSGSTWTLDPGEVLYLITGHGLDEFSGTAKPPAFLFYWNREAFVWNNTGDHVYLRRPNGEFLTQPFPIP